MKSPPLTLVTLVLAACAPPSDLDPSRIDEPRVLAVRMDPPQGTSGATDVTFTALVATPEGTTGTGAFEWAWCLEPRLPTDSTNIPARCSASGGRLVGFDVTGPSAHAVVPAGACSIVGPTPPPVGPDAHPQSSPAPDATGGYGVPARLLWTGNGAFDTAFARVRIDCPRPDVSADVTLAYAALARPNRNPTIARVDRVDARGVVVPLIPEGSGAEQVAVRGDAISLTLTVAADSDERYARISADGRSVQMATEGLEVSWFAAGGRFDVNRTAASGTGTRNVLHVDAAGTSSLTAWVIVRDGRGGTDWAAFRWAVR